MNEGMHEHTEECLTGCTLLELQNKVLAEMFSYEFEHNECDCEDCA